MPKKPNRSVPTEHTEQAKLVARVRNFARGVLIFAVPNGGKRNMKEAVRLKAEGVTAGVPDLVVAQARGGFFGLYIEMKRQKGSRLSDEQRDRIAELRAEGYAVEVCEGVEEAWAAFERYHALPRTPRGVLS